MGRRRRSSVVPFALLGAAVSLGVVAVTASRFGWRRARAAGGDASPPATADEDALPGAGGTEESPTGTTAPSPTGTTARRSAAGATESAAAVDARHARPQLPRVRRFAPAVRWDASPEEYAAARASGDPPVP